MFGADDYLKVEQKWGFGMAPVKPAALITRKAQAEEVLEWLEGRRLESIPNLDSISQIKGLFTRIYKQDQWDWFTVWTQLGRPGTKRSKNISDSLYELRKALSSSDFTQASVTTKELQNLGTNYYLSHFLSPKKGFDDSESIGKIYILSTRESKDILKIGYTNRTVEERVKEINSATGVLIPYGVRALWVIKSAKEIEGDLHKLFAAFRIRQDREFFQMDFKDAFRFISNYIREKREEI
jgi:hypothetical protein